ncbi:MAG: iron-sulfur cluster assembly scaffold protein [Betaproteobacteria bacterium]|nr:MAG: iron-sulfur cluster assembly scaffold protein [Betaproteobacteria bacterium]
MTAGAPPYGSAILEHFRRPRNQRRLERPSAAHEAYNPLCGDRVRLELEIDGLVVRAAAFTANACAICTAAASILTERLTGATLEDAAGVRDAEMLAALGGEGAVPPARVTCALLPLQALRAALAAWRTQA